MRPPVISITISRDDSGQAGLFNLDMPQIAAEIEAAFGKRRTIQPLDGDPIEDAAVEITAITWDEGRNSFVPNTPDDAVIEIVIAADGLTTVTSAPPQRGLADEPPLIKFAIPLAGSIMFGLAGLLGDVQAADAAKADDTDIGRVLMQIQKSPHVEPGRVVVHTPAVAADALGRQRFWAALAMVVVEWWYASRVGPEVSGEYEPPDRSELRWAEPERNLYG